MKEQMVAFCLFSSIWAMDIWDIFDSPISWDALSIQFYVGVLGAILMLVGGLLLTRWERHSSVAGLILLLGGSAGLLWALGVL